MKFYLRMKTQKFCQETTELTLSRYIPFFSDIFLFDASNFGSSLVTKIYSSWNNIKVNFNSRKKYFYKLTTL